MLDSSNNTMTASAPIDHVAPVRDVSLCEPLTIASLPGITIEKNVEIRVAPEYDAEASHSDATLRG
jgi:hypothetical protein